MGQYIVKLKEYYLIWSSIVDAPLCICDSVADVTDYIREEYGCEGVRNLPPRLARVEAKGTSSLGEESAISTIWLNRAGPNESTLTIEGIYRHYCLDEPLQDAWIIPRDVVLDDSTDDTLYDMVTAGWCDEQAG